MSNSRPSHAFISFASQDREIALRIARHVRRKGIAVWIAPQELTPGTRNWEEAIREALSQSFAVVLLASEDSRRSDHVLGELEVAEANGCRILPVWVRGSQWANCIPLKWTRSQRIDLRQGDEGPALDALCRSLEDTLREAMPRLFVGRARLSELRSPAGVPAGYVPIDLGAPEGEPGWNQRREVAFLRTADYGCLNAVLDDLYVSCLQERYPLNAYGTAWFLKERVRESMPSAGLVLTSWDWLTTSGAPRVSLVEWLIDTPASMLSSRPGALWEVCPAEEVGPLGLAVHDLRLLAAIRSSPKALDFLTSMGVLQKCTAAAVAGEWEHRFVFDQVRFGPQPGPRGESATVFVQTSEPLNEKLLGYWLREG